MTPTETGLFVGQGVTVLVALITGGYALLNKKTRAPADDNEAMKLGNEFLRGLLADAKSEREELKATIEGLKADTQAHKASVDRLEGLLRHKDDRIAELESIIDRLVAKLGQGELITVSDLFVKQANPAT